MQPMRRCRFLFERLWLRVFGQHERQNQERKLLPGVLFEPKLRQDIVGHFLLHGGGLGLLELFQ